MKNFIAYDFETTGGTQGSIKSYKLALLYMIKILMN